MNRDAPYQPRAASAPRDKRPGLLARFRRSESGAVSIPAVMYLPVFIMILAASVELCVLILKQTMMERGLDVTTRVLRLGLDDLPEHDELKRSICNAIALIPSCMEDLTVEVYAVDSDSWTSTLAGTSAMCRDRDGQQDVAGFIEGGSSDQLMLMRACLKVEPMMALNPLGMALARSVDGEYALVSTTSFVNEPRITSGNIIVSGNGSTDVGH
ncbi:MAG: pilus assembly protein [Paracoccaceae bacterium]|jgi:Flp pilus assembly protein TadG